MIEEKKRENGGRQKNEEPSIFQRDIFPYIRWMLIVPLALDSPERGGGGRLVALLAKQANKPVCLSA